MTYICLAQTKKLILSNKNHIKPTYSFIVPLFITAKTWEQPKYFSAGECINKL